MPTAGGEQVPGALAVGQRSLAAPGRAVHRAVELSGSRGPGWFTAKRTKDMSLREASVHEEPRDISSQSMWPEKRELGTHGVKAGSWLRLGLRARGFTLRFGTGWLGSCGE